MDHTIIVTHIENPYLFWFKYDCGERDDANGRSLDENLHKYAEQVRNAGRQSSADALHVGEYVAARIESAAAPKWIRGYLEEAGKCCSVWCIETGRVFQVPADCLVPLANTEFASHPTCGILKGSLCDSRPGRLVRCILRASELPHVFAV